MMTCKEVLESLSGYLDEDLKQEVVVEMKKHIGLCTDCRAEFDTLTMTIKLYRHFETPQMPADCHDRLVKVLELEKLKRPSDKE
ncbi:MAG TPA: zf-HC2 domain-containing protein [Candidatus Eisenbacteria bacterium]|jgi:predicted anti-sigma-YlaC factor YlaD|nr:zf-HC2 domain-containing protein [Candidatus Eisenbacteria bacterium]